MSEAGRAPFRPAVEVSQCVSISSWILQLARDLQLQCSLVKNLRLEAPPSTDDVAKPMMKIQMKELDGQLILQVEGRLAGAFVPELEDCWQGARANQPQPATGTQKRVQ